MAFQYSQDFPFIISRLLLWKAPLPATLFPGSLILPPRASEEGTGRRGPWERGCIARYYGRLMIEWSGMKFAWCYCQMATPIENGQGCLAEIVKEFQKGTVQ